MTSPSRYRVAVLGGDGIGPEVTAAARQVLEAAAARDHFTIAFDDGLIGGAAIDACGVPLPEATTACCRRADAVLLGAVGGPRWDNLASGIRPEQGLLAIRRALGLFANLRPVAPHPALLGASPLRAERLAGVDLVIVRELTGGIYFGDKMTVPLEGGGERATDLCVYETHEIERIARVAAALARSRGGRLTSVDKANVLETSRLWRKTVTRVVADEFPDVVIDHLLVDACAMHLVTQPARFDVIVTENMFGDILTDEAAVLTGSIGVLPSASLGVAAGSRRMGLYEPIHGSAPDIAGQGIANPLGAILSAALLLRHSLDRVEAASRIERAVDVALGAGARTPDLGGARSTQQVCDAVLESLAAD
ncbi:MAG: 3-isopropylmalate dehydrogenase [Thermoanaerobaculia bacterium]